MRTFSSPMELASAVSPMIRAPAPAESPATGGTTSPDRGRPVGTSCACKAAASKVTVSRTDDFMGCDSLVCDVRLRSGEPGDAGESGDQDEDGGEQDARQVA